MLKIDVANIEIHPPVKIDYGFQLRFTIMVKAVGKDNMAALKKLKRLIKKQEMNKTIQNVWNMENMPRISNLKWKKDRS